MIRLRGIARHFTSPDGERVEVLKHLDLDIAPGSFTVIRGKSGSGKTTLLRILGLLDTEYAGIFEFDGIDMGDRPDWFLDEMRSANIGFVFQEGRLLDHLTLRQNIETTLRLQRPDIDTGPAADALAVRFFDDQQEMKEVLARAPGAVSGGQKQRASIIRAIAAAPALVLADEPTASLHGDLKLGVVRHLQQLAQEGHTVVVVSHDDVFHTVGRQLDLVGGKLVEAAPVPAGSPPDDSAPDRETLAARQPDDGRTLLWGWRPRLPAWMLIGQALREMIARPLFLFLILAALAVGACQVSVFASIIYGSGDFIESRIREGSRLNRIQVKPRPADMDTANIFPMRDEIASWDIVDKVVPRRSINTGFRLQDGRKATFTAMGLQPDDPEYDLLAFAAGGAFSGEHDQLEMIVTTALLPTLFDMETPEDAGGDAGTGYYDSVIGRQAEIVVARYNTDREKVGEVTMKLRVVGVILHAEGNRQLYLPTLTIRAIDRLKRDRTGEVDLPLDEDRGGWTDTKAVHALADFPWENRLHVYMKSVNDVIPALSDLGKLGLAPRSDIWTFKWALDIQETALRIFFPLLVMIIVAVSITVAANIFASAKLRETELALWRILGMRRGDLVLSQVISTVCAVVMGTLGGLALGYALVDNSKSLLAQSAAEQQAQTGARAVNFDMLFAPVQNFFVLILAGALIIGILAALYPAWRTSRVDPAKVLRG